MTEGRNKSARSCLMPSVLNRLKGAVIAMGPVARGDANPNSSRVKNSLGVLNAMCVLGSNIVLEVNIGASTCLKAGEPLEMFCEVEVAIWSDDKSK